MKLFKTLILVLFTIYLISKPFYLWGSGLPQIADMILVFIIILFLIKYEFEITNLFLMSMIFIFYIFLVNSLFMIIYASTSFSFSSFYYVFNIFVFLTVVNFGRIYEKKLYKFLFYGIVFSVLIQVLLSFFFSHGNSFRETLFFNNPNQLGYYSVLSLAIIILLYKSVKPKIIIPLIFFFLTLYLAILSASQAATISLVVMIILFIVNEILKSKVKSKLNIISLLLIILIIFSIIKEPIQSSGNFQQSIDRIFDVDFDVNSNVEERRFDRVFDNKQYLVFGAGEGLFHERFGVGEIHNTFISLFFNYGIIGFMIFITILFLMLKRIGVSELIPLVGISLYGLTHNGIRQTLLWILLGIIYLYNKNEVKNSNES